MSIRNHLIVGSNGVIGAALLARLQQEMGAAVYGTAQRQLERPNIFYLNLLDPESAWNFPDVRFDMVYLCAGICRMALCEEDVTGTRQVNIDGMIRVARHFAAQGAFIVYLSTNQVFSGEQPLVAANAPYQPRNEYGQQKAIVEQWITTHCPHSAILRLTKVMTPNMDLIKDWADRLAQHQAIETFYDMTLAPVSLRQVLNVLLLIGEKQVPGCYQLSGAHDISYYDLARYLAIEMQRDMSLVQAVSAISRGIKKSFLPPFTTLDCSSTIALGGEKPPHLSEVMAECFDFLSDVSSPRFIADGGTRHVKYQRLK